MRAQPGQRASSGCGIEPPAPSAANGRSCRSPRHASRRGALLLGPAAAAALLLPRPAAAQFACPGERGYALQQCLRRERQARREAEGDGGGGGGGGAGGVDELQAERLKYRQYVQPGELVTLPSGIQYRELRVGAGRAAEPGCTLEIAYTVYRLSARATPVYAWSFGTGQGGPGGRDDVGEVYAFRLGDPAAVPRAAAAGMLGMREGGRRRVLVPPALGWTDDSIGPPRPDFTATRRLATHGREPLLFEAELVRVRPPPPAAAGEGGSVDELLRAEAAALLDLAQRPGAPFRLPAPRSPYQNKLG